MAAAVALGIEVVRDEPGHGTCRLTIAGEHLNQGLVAHGSVLFTLADTALGVAANPPGEPTWVGTQFSLQLFRAVAVCDSVVGEARRGAPLTPARDPTRCGSSARPTARWSGRWTPIAGGPRGRPSPPARIPHAGTRAGRKPLARAARRGGARCRPAPEGELLVAADGGPVRVRGAPRRRAGLRLGPPVGARPRGAPRATRGQQARQRRHADQPRPDVRADDRADSDTNSGRGRRSRGRARPGARPVGRLDVLDEEHVGSRASRCSRVLDEPLERPARRAHALDRRDLASIERIGLIFSAEPIHACAPPIRPPRRRYSSVSTANRSSARSARAARRAARRPRVGAARAAFAAAIADQPVPRAAGLGVHHLDPPGATPRSTSASRACSAARTVPEMPPEMWIETMSCPALEQRLVDGEEVAHRRLRRARQLATPSAGGRRTRRSRACRSRDRCARPS